MATSTTSKALLAAVFVAGGATTLTASQLFGSSAAAAAGYRFQNDHVWVARFNPDGGIPFYASRTCGHMVEKDGGVSSDVCSKDGEEMTVTAAKAYESYLKARGITVPR